MGLLKTRKNKEFGYEPRYWNDNGEGNPYKLKGKFDEQRTTLSASGGLVNRFKTAWNEYKTEQDKSSHKTIIIIAAILIFIFLWIIDFDLTIFSDTY